MNFVERKKIDAVFRSRVDFFCVGADAEPGGAARFFKRADREKWADSPKFCGFAGNFRAFRPKRFFYPDLKNKIADV